MNDRSEIVRVKSRRFVSSEQKRTEFVARKTMENLRERGCDAGYSESILVNNLQLLFQDHSQISADELAHLGQRLVVGNADDFGFMIRLARENLLRASELLLAAALLPAWKGGNWRHTFLPDPITTRPRIYECSKKKLLSWLNCTRGDRRRILSNVYGRDRDFYDSLPDRFMVFRGCCGITAETAASGLCWTTSRSTAEWFAISFATSDFRRERQPIVVASEIDKADVYAAFASEHEIVCRPATFEHLQVREVREPSPGTWGEERHQQVSEARSFRSLPSDRFKRGRYQFTHGFSH